MIELHAEPLEARAGAQVLRDVIRRDMVLLGELTSDNPAHPRLRRQIMDRCRQLAALEQAEDGDESGGRDSTLATLGVLLLGTGLLSLIAIGQAALTQTWTTRGWIGVYVLTGLVILYISGGLAMLVAGRRGLPRRRTRHRQRNTHLPRPRPDNDQPEPRALSELRLDRTAH